MSACEGWDERRSLLVQLSVLPGDTNPHLVAAFYTGLCQMLTK